MKEIWKPTVANLPQTPYSRGGDNFMAEGRKDMHSLIRQPANPSSPGLEQKENLSLNRKELRDQWHRVLTEKELNNPDTRSTVETAISLGIAPQSVTSKGDRKMEAREVIANTLLTDQQRIKKAEELLGQQLSEEQKSALLKAHYEGGQEKGKSGHQAGVYNYTEAQLLRKVRILKDEGQFDDSQRRMLIEAGLAATPIPNLLTTYTDPVLQRIALEYQDQVNRINSINPTQGAGNSFLIRQFNRIEALQDQGRVDPAQARHLLAFLQATFDAENPQTPQRQRGSFFYLQDEEKDELDKGWTSIEKWMNNYFDIIYEASKGKDPLQSPVTSRVQQTFSDAVSYLSIRGKTDEIARLTELFDTRIKLMQMASSVGTKNLEAVHKAAQELTAHGLLGGVILDDRRVGSMYNRLEELLEDTRLDKRDEIGYGGRRQHVSPEMLQFLLIRTINEQVGLAEKGVGDFADFYQNKTGNPQEKRAAAQTEVTRSVRTAYDILVSSQRVAVIAARGRDLLDTDRYFSDPGSTFSMFNIEAYSSDKWELFNAEDDKFLQTIKNGLVKDYIEEKRAEDVTVEITNEERIELGKRLLKDIAAVPDFFSSSWRIKGITDQIERYFVYREAVSGEPDPDNVSKARAEELVNEIRKLPIEIPDPSDPLSNPLHPDHADVRKLKPINRRTIAIDKAEDFALFLRIRGKVTGPEDKAKKIKIWEKVQVFKPEEIVKLLHERQSPEYRKEMNDEIFVPYGFANYDDFKVRYGAILRAVREEGFKSNMPTQTDFTHLSTEQIAMINNFYPGEADKVTYIFNAMKQHIDSKGVIGQLMDNHRFVDIYTRTITSDDALLDIVERPPENSGMIAISRMWGGAEIGNDALVRNMNDILAAKKGHDAFVGFVKTEGEEEKLKQAQIFASATADYNGRGAEAMVIKHTIIAYLELTRIPGFWNALGVAKLPFREPMTAIERIYGPNARPLSQQERRAMVDKIRVVLMASVTGAREKIQEDLLKQKENIDDDLSLSSDEKKEAKNNADQKAQDRMYSAEDKAEFIYKKAEESTQVSNKDMAQQKALDFFIAFILWVLLEGVKATGITEVSNGGRR